MANGSFDYKTDPRFKRVLRGAQFGAYDEDALKQALQAPELTGIEGYNPLEALQHTGDVWNTSSFGDYTTGLTQAITADPGARDPGFGGMSFSEFQRLFPERAQEYTRSAAFKQANMPTPAAPAQGKGVGTQKTTCRRSRDHEHQGQR